MVSKSDYWVVFFVEVRNLLDPEFVGGFRDGDGHTNTSHVGRIDWTRSVIGQESFAPGVRRTGTRPQDDAGGFGTTPETVG